jgi:UDP-glucose 4-epimerase
MKILITGGAGFVGSHLSRYLFQQGHKVTIYDNLSNSTKEKLSDLLKYDISFVRGDVTNYKSLQKNLKGFDFVIHLAAKINVDESIRNPELTHSVNVTGTVNVLHACVENNIKNVIAASSAAVYGNTTKIPLDENSQNVPISPYGASKLSLEHYLQAFSNSYSINSISLRFFNIYGVGQSIAYAGVIKIFMENIRENKPLVIFGDGKNTRDFISIDDLVRSVNLAMKKITGKKGNIYNIATGRSVSINELARLMLSISGKRLAIVHKNPKKGDVRHSKASIALAKKDLGYFPKILLKEGLENLMNTS